MLQNLANFWKSFPLREGRLLPLTAPSNDLSHSHDEGRWQGYSAALSADNTHGVS